MFNLRNRSFLKELDFEPAELRFLLELAGSLKVAKYAGTETSHLEGREIALIFEKTSTRTRAAFEVAAHDQGGHVTYLGPDESHLGSGESVKDTARVLGRMYDGIEFRGFTQESVEILGKFAGVPVWNGLTDTWHPTQMLADMLTMRDHAGKPLDAVWRPTCWRRSATPTPGRAMSPSPSAPRIASTAIARTTRSGRPAWSRRC